MLKKILMLSCFTCFSANAGWLAQESPVVAVESTSMNLDVFTVIVKGGNGPCTSSAGDILITFPKSEASSPEIHNRTYAMLLSAFSTGSKVSIYNYKDDSCHKAVGVRIFK